MKDKMSSIYQNRQTELEQLFIEAEEYGLLKGKTSVSDFNFADHGNTQSGIDTAAVTTPY
jgi:hypothetical protein